MLKSVLLTPVFIFAMQFTQLPELTSLGGGQWRIEFAVDESTDVEVAVVDTSDSSIVRRLIAGRLGSNPPAPLQAGTLHQVITWDGMDDAGIAVANTASLAARVRAGMIVNTVADFVGGNPYDFNYSLGAAVNTDGSVYIYGRIAAVCSDQLSAVRKYDANSGRYLKTIFPYPAGLDSAQVAGWGMGMREDRTYHPKYSSFVVMNMSKSIVTQPGTRLCPFLLDGSLLFHRPVTVTTQTAWMGYLVGDNGSFLRYPGHVRFIMNPTATPDLGGLFMAKGPDAGSVLLSNAFSSVTPNFWMGGKVYKLDLATGTATVWGTPVSPDSGGYMASVHGIALDDSGRLFVCDSFHHRIGVYDTATWAPIASIPVTDPHAIEINRQTNEIYVLCNTAGQNITVRKFSGFRNPTQTALLSLSSVARGSESRMAVWQGGDNPVLWVSGTDVWGVRDEGGSFTLITRFSDSCAGLRHGVASPGSGVVAYQRMAVDRKTETLYAANGWALLVQVRDWLNPRPERCMKSTGGYLNGGDVAMSPDGHLYVREGDGYAGPITRYTTDARPAPAPFQSGSNVADSFYNGKYGNGFGDKGIAVSRTGRVGIMEGAPGHACEQCWARAKETDGSVTPLVYPILAWWQFGAVGGASNAGGIKFDYDGNVYVGVNLKGPGAPSNWLSSDGWGCVIKFPPNGGFIYKLPAEPKVNEGTPSDSIYDAITIYPQPYSSFAPGLTAGGCGCQNPRFDLDGYGRLFMPDMVHSRISVADNAGNTVAAFGHYGNIDDPAASIPLASPLGVAASDDFIYVGDINNARLTRVRMDFMLNNLPWLGQSAAERNGTATRAVPTLAAAPNPFNPAVAFTLTGKEMQGASLKVFDMSGRLVADLSGRVNAGRVVWNAQGCASGMYVAVARKGNLELTKKIVYSR